MATPEILDFSGLLEPISAENPVGEDLRSDSSPTSVYYQVKDARNRARAAERQAAMVGVDEAEPADWRPIIEAVPEILSSKSKDLEVTAYLVEALAREQGFAGLRDGFRLLRELVERYGDDIYPLPDEDGEESRVAPLIGLNGEGTDGTLIGPINNITLTSSADGQFGVAQYTQAQDLSRATDEARERRMSQGAVSLEQFRVAVAETNAEFFRNLFEDLQAATDEFSQLEKVCDETFKEYPPPTSAIRHALEACGTTLQTVAGDVLATIALTEEETNEEGETEGDAESGGTSARPKASVGEIHNREDAFREILRISEYFRRTEPHTPISYALEQIVRWGRLPLPDLLQELIADESSVSQMFRLVGIRGPADGEGPGEYQ